jgi:preprotein translocase subunit SecY
LLFILGFGADRLRRVHGAAQRRLLVQYPKRQQGNRVFGGESSHLPLKINVAGVIPPIFASSLLLLPMTVANFNAANIPAWLQTLSFSWARPAAVHPLLRRR